MNFEPSKFFIGLTDFFSIFLPGALLTYVTQFFWLWLLGISQPPAGGEGWVMFLFGSYLMGHFIFLVGSWLLDDYVYEPVRNGTTQRQIERLAKGAALSSLPIRYLALWCIQRGADSSFLDVVRIKKHYLDPLGVSTMPNTYQWSIARLALSHPDARQAVQRYEADSKFFRSLVVVIFLFILWKTVELQFLAVAIFLILLCLSLWRYIDQRIKAINHAYWFITTLEGETLKGYRSRESDNYNNIRAGGIVYRSIEGRIEYLFIQAKDLPNEWVLPKGHVESGESMEQAAVREVREEAGTWARIKCALPKMSICLEGDVLEVSFFLMEALEVGKPCENRARLWLPLGIAAEQVTHPESIEMLNYAEKARSALHQMVPGRIN